jgi:hypothetical protein
MSGAQTRHRYSAVLTCGSVLYYDYCTFVPRIGERVPCLRHDFCRVEAAGARASAPDRQARRPRAHPRTTAELLCFLEGRPASTVAELRRHRFTLRLVSLAAADGLVLVEAGECGPVVRSRAR